MRARAVIGANFGDEGKGLIVDYLCRTEGAGMVVRFNGGAQAGHTVVTPEGQRHVFAHFGAGTFAGVPTFLSPFFICNPLLFFKELEKLNALGVHPVVYAHPECLITTFADMIMNQRREDKLGDQRHGSCGVGVNETIKRSRIPNLKITMGDLWNHMASLETKIEEICLKYAEFRTGAPIVRPDMIKHFIPGCWAFAEHVRPLGIEQCKDPVFEGAQGLLLDQNNKEYFPHLTRSNTGMKNVRSLCVQAGITDIDAYYVSRTYLTRHGAGPLPGENSSLHYYDDTNLDHNYQGRLRFARLDWNSMVARCKADGGAAIKFAVTHLDQFDPGVDAAFLSYGPTCNDVEVAPRARLKKSLP